MHEPRRLDMAGPDVIPPHAWKVGSAGRNPLPLVLLGTVLLVIGFLVFVLGAALGFVFSGIPFGAAIPFCGFGLVIIGIVLLAFARGTQRRALPPPPPIQQQPMVPAGTQGPLELACPNCGAAPRNIDRFGVATCDYCGTRFLVR